MAQDIIIRTLCDVCLSEDEERHDAQPFVLSNGPKLLDIDLCDVHAKPLADLIEHARPHEAKGGKPGGMACEVCGKVLQTERGLRKHRSQQHGQPDESATLFGVEGTSCPDCGREFPTRQGVSMHRFRVHGIRSDGSRSEPAPAPA